MDRFSEKLSLLALLLNQKLLSGIPDFLRAPACVSYNGGPEEGAPLTGFVLVQFLWLILKFIGIKEETWHINIWDMGA